MAKNIKKVESKQDKPLKMKCPSCGKDKLTNREFYLSNSPKYDTYDHRCYTCKVCLKNLIHSANGLLDKDLFKKVLQDYLDKPFYEKLYQQALQDEKDTLGRYLSLLNITKKNNVFWEDGETEENQKYAENSSVRAGVNLNFNVTPYMAKFWGEYKPEDYEFLEEYYNDLIKIYDHSLPVQINNYKNMAKTQLQANKSLANGDIPNYEKAMKILSLLSGDSNIKPVQETSAGNVDKGSFGVFIKKVEDEEPIPRWVEDLGNEDRLDKYIRNFFFGNLAKVLSIKNPWEKEFNDEMKQYTVDKSEVEEEKNIQDFLGE